MHHEQACREASGLEKALHGPTPGESVRIDTDAALSRAPVDHLISHRPPNPVPSGKRVDIQVLDRPDAFAVRELQQATSAIAHDIAASTRTSSALRADSISAVHSPAR